MEMGFLETKEKKEYNAAKDEFVAVGSYNKIKDMYCAAAHPRKGLWICSFGGKADLPFPIGFIAWDDIDRIVVDKTNDRVFVVPKDFCTKNYSLDYRLCLLLARDFHMHRMSDTGEKALMLPYRGWDGNGFVQYISSVVPTEEREEPVNMLRIFLFMALRILVAFAVLFPPLFYAFLHLVRP